MFEEKLLWKFAYTSCTAGELIFMHSHKLLNSCSSAQVLAGCPREAPVYSSSQPGSRTIFARVLSCPSMLAAQPAHHAGADMSSTKKRAYEYMSSSEDAAPPSPAATENDSGISAATAEDATCARMDTSPFAAFCKLSGYAA